ncbi:NAD(P)-dependent alcohol dehydrogenase [Streptomyces sp. NPDC044571]|uniref:NAD(P)-dependent alcohol dehydrogenase n=1 Tax=Streptomyces sp. NPDC044571 TaxID=3155371 RepID=UPI0033E1848C
MEAMRAIVQEGYGPPDVLRPAEVPRPVPAAGEVLLRVRAAGVDRGTWHAMTGRPYAVRLALGLRGPRSRVAGLDVAGTVVALGEGVTGFAVGDEVYGVARGSFAEYATARADRIAPKPARLGFEEAAVVAVSACTALRGLRDAGRVRPGQRVLVVGASGGVGTYAVQLAKAFGAEVTGVCSAAKADLVHSIGADRVIDYAREDFAADGRRWDLVLDIGGSSPLSRLRRALTPRGTLVIAGGEDAGDWIGMGRQFGALALSPFVRQRLAVLFAAPRRADLDTLNGLIEAGSLTPVVGATYGLDAVPEAVRRLAAGQARGKTAITIAPAERDAS